MLRLIPLVGALGILSLPALAQNEDRIRELVEQLSSESIFERQNAEEELLLLGTNALPVLERVSANLRDPEARDGVGRIRRHLRTEARRAELSVHLSKPVASESDIVRQLISSDPRRIVKALGSLTGRVAIYHGGTFRYERRSRATSAQRADLLILLGEILDRVVREDPRWVSVVGTGLLAVQENVLHELLPSVEPYLKSDIVQLRRLAVSTIGRAGRGLDKESRRPWSRKMEPLLRDESDTVRAAAAAAFLKLGTRENLSALLRLRRDREPAVRRKVIDGIVRWEAPDRVNLLVVMTHDEDAAVRRRAVNSIASIKAAEALPKMHHLLEDTNEYVRLDYLNTIRNLGHAESTPQVARALRDGCTFVRSRALEILEMFEAREHAAAVASLLEDHEFERIRLRAIRTLGTWEAKEQVADLARLLNDPAAYIRLATLESLHRLKARGTSARIARLLQDPVVEVRRASIRILVDWREQPAELKKLMAGPDKELALETACILVESGDRLGMQHLISAATAGTRHKARALYTLNALAAPKLFARLRSAPLREREFDDVPLEAVLSAIQQDLGIRFTFDKSFTGDFSARTDGTAADLLLHVAERGQNRFAFLLDEESETIRVVTSETARVHWIRAAE